MRREEKQLITGLSAAIILVAVLLVYCLIVENRSSAGEQSAVVYEDQEQEEDKEIAQNDSSDEKKDSETSEESAVADSSEDADDDKTPAQIMDADDGYIFPDVGSAYLDEEDIKALTTEEIQYAINEVYARHGLKFTKQSNKERFEKKKWYTGTVDDQDDIKLNQYENKNVDLMADILEQKGAR